MGNRWDAADSVVAVRLFCLVIRELDPWWVCLGSLTLKVGILVSVFRSLHPEARQPLSCCGHSRLIGLFHQLKGAKHVGWGARFVG